MEFYSSISFCTYVYSSAIGRVFCRIFGARGCPRLSVFLFGPRSVGNPSCCVVSGSVTRLCLWSARVQHACLSSLVRMSLLRELLFFFVVGSVATIGGTPWQVCGFVAVCLFAEPRLECEVWPFMGNAVTSLTWNIPPQIPFLMTLLFQS